MNKKTFILPAIFLAVLVSAAASVLAATTTTITPGTAIAGETDLFCHINVNGQEVSVNDIYPYTIAWKSDAIGATWDYLGIQELGASALSKYINHEIICAVGYTYTQGGQVIFIQIFPDSNSVPVEPDYTPAALLIVPSQAYVNENVELVCSASGGNKPLIIEIDAEGNGNFQDVTGLGFFNHVYTGTGNYNPECRVTDFDGDTATDYADIKIIEGGIENHMPVITSAPVTEVDEQEFYTYDVEAYDPDGDTLTYSLIQRPGWLSINPNTGFISGTAPEVSGDTGFNVAVRVSDGEDFAIQTFTITVKDIAEEEPENHAPIIISSPVTQVDEQEFYTYNVNAYDADGDTLRYSLIIAPNWLTIDSQTGLIYGTAPEVDENTLFRVIARVSDGRWGGTDSQFYFLTVRDVAESDQLEIISTPVTEINETDFYEYYVEAEGGVEPYEFSLTEAPLWLSINPNTGFISGTAPEISGDTNFDISVKVTDNEGNEDEQFYTLTVKNISEQEEKPERSARGGGIGVREIPEDEFYKSLYFSQFEKVFGIAIEDTQAEEKPKMVEKLLIWIIFLILLVLAVITTVNLIRKIKQ
jgi:hypothetical protein